MYIVVSDEVYSWFEQNYSDYPNIFLGNNTLDLFDLVEAGIYEVKDDGYYNTTLRPSEEGGFFPMTT